MEHMCTRCARLFLQGARSPMRRTTVSQLRPFSFTSSSLASGPFDLSQPLPSRSDNKDQSSEQEDSSNQQPEILIRKIIPGISKPSGAPISDPRSSVRGNVSRTSAQNTSDSSRQRSFRPIVRKVRLDSSRPSNADLPGGVVRTEDRSSIAVRGTPTSMGRTRSQVEPNRSVDARGSSRRFPFGSSQSPPGGFPSTRHQAQASSFSDTKHEIEEVLDTEAEIDPDYPSALDEFTDEELDNLTMENRSALIRQLTVKHDRECTLIENLLDDDAEALTEEEMQKIVNQLNLPLPEEAELDFNLIYNSNYASMSPNDLMRQMYLLDQLAENADNITEEDKKAIVTSLQLQTDEDGTIIDLQERRDSLINAANDPEGVDNEESPLVDDGEPAYASQQMLARFNEAAGQSIDNLSKEEIIELARKLGYVDPDGDVFYPWRGEDPELQDPSINQVDPEVLRLAKEAGFIDDQGNLNFPPEEEILARAQELGIADEEGRLIVPTKEQSAAAEAEAESSGMNAKLAEIDAQSSADADEANEDDEGEEEYDEEGHKDADRPLTEEEEIQKYIDEVVDPSPIPTVTLPHSPTLPSTEVLREDWPNTPLSPTGLTESVIQKVTFLAQRLPHGHWTPAQIAERFEQGYMVRFNSEEEKQIVLQVAAKLATARAEKAAEISGQDVVPEGMEFSSLVEGSQAKEKDGLVDAMVRGAYPGSESNAATQQENGQSSEGQSTSQGKFIDGVLRQLANNETYKGEDERKFVDRVQALLEKAGAKRSAPGGAGGQGRTK